MAKQFYIKERHNPQFKQPYYIALGQLSKKEANMSEKTIYGYNNIIAFQSQDEYESAINKYKLAGFNVTINPENN